MNFNVGICLYSLEIHCRSTIVMYKTPITIRPPKCYRCNSNAEIVSEIHTLHTSYVIKKIMQQVRNLYKSFRQQLLTFSGLGFENEMGGIPKYTNTKTLKLSHAHLIESLINFHVKKLFFLYRRIFLFFLFRLKREINSL